MSKCEIAKRLKNIRTASGLTQEQFAAKVGVTVSTINRWETGKSKPSPLAMRRVQELNDNNNSDRQ